MWRIDKNDLKGQTATLTWTLGSTTRTQTETTDVLFRNMGDTKSDGWRPDTEQTDMNTTWTGTFHKVGHVGEADGKWMNTRPAANAILNMVETTDQTGTTVKPSAQTSQIQLKQDGTGVFPTQVIGMGETRYYKVWESQVNKPFNKPKNDAYWIITATQTPARPASSLRSPGQASTRAVRTDVLWTMQEPVRRIVRRRH